MKKVVTYILLIICLLLVGCGGHKHEYYNGICNCGEMNVHMHEFIDGVCACGKEVSGYSGKVNDFYIEGNTVKKYMGVKTDVEIPERYLVNNEYVLVTTLDKNIFTNGVLNISLYIPITIKQIDPQALIGAGTLRTIQVSNFNKHYISIDGDLYTRDKTTLVRFACSTFLDEYKVIDSVTTIGDFAFAYAMINKLIINENVTSIGNASFYGSLLSNIEISENNANYTVEDNVIYSKDKTTLVYYMSSKTNQEFTIPSSVTTIKEAAFYNPMLLGTITIPNSVTTVEKNAFVLLKEAVVKCEQASKPSTWDNEWINNNEYVSWGTK